MTTRPIPSSTMQRVEHELVLRREEYVRKKVKGAYLIGIISLVASYFFGSILMASLSCLWLVSPWEQIYRKKSLTMFMDAHERLMQINVPS